MDISPEKQDNSDKKETNPEELINTNKINEEKDKEQDKEKDSDIFDDESSHESVFDEESSEKAEENNNNKNNGLMNHLFLENKKKRELTEEQKEQRIKKNIEKYCLRNDRMLELLDKINKGETTRKNINEMMRLLAIDLSDTKKLTNSKTLISQRKKDLFNKLFDLTFTEYQFFWFQLTNGKYKKGNAQLINSSNMHKARTIYNEIIEKRKKEVGDNKAKKELTVREIIKDRNNKEFESEKLDEIFMGYDSQISSDEDSLDSSVDESSSESESDVKNNIDKEKEEKIRKEKEEKEKEERKKREEERRIMNEKVKKFIDNEDEIDIFN